MYVLSGREITIATLNRDGCAGFDFVYIYRTIHTFWHCIMALGSLSSQVNGALLSVQVLSHTHCLNYGLYSTCIHLV